MVNNRFLSIFKKIPKLFSDSNLSKKASLNAITSLLDYFANIIVAFLVTPIIVAGLGDYYYGAWQILKGLIGYISPASGRPAQALKFTLAQQQNSSDFELKRKYVGSTLVVFALFLPLMTLLGALLTWFIPYWIKTPAQYVWGVRVACAVLVVNLIVDTIATIPRSVLQGENKGYKRMGLSTLLVFLGGGLTWLALYLNSGIIGLACATLLTTCIQGLFFLQVMHTNSPWIGVAKPTKGEVRSFLGLSWWFMAWNLVNILMMASDVVVLGLLNSVESVTNYTLSKYAPETGISIVAMMVFGILPGLAGIIGSRDLAKAAKIRGELMSFTWLIVTVLGTGILLWNEIFLQMWVGPNHYVGNVQNILIIFVVIQFVFIRNDANIIDLTLRLNKKVILGAISVAVSIGVASFLVYFLKMGIIGVCLGLIIGRLLLSIAYPVLNGRFLKIKFTTQLRAIIRPGLVTLLIFITTIGIERILPISRWHSLGGWILFILAAGLTALVTLTIAFFLGLTRGQENVILQRVRTVLSISRKS